MPLTLETSLSQDQEIDLNTFSIAATDGLGSFGVAVSTARPNVGSLVPFVSLKGAVATQARVNTDLGRHGLALLEAGVSLGVGLGGVLERDPNPTLRQLHAVSHDESFAFTGQDCVEWAGHLKKDKVTVAGNMLKGPHVIEAMMAAFEKSLTLELSEGLLLALEAGQAAGGDKRGKVSAALLVASPKPRLYHNIRVDEHTNPVAELRRIYGLLLEQSEAIKKDYGEEGLALFSKVKT
ncbi:MAG: DUF1028 domain-containing protein [Deinococcales bacterium]